ncbi:MAG: N-6 DNA methylase [Anaerolineae bacterium]
MLDTDTRRRIDTARDILVGKVPDPKSQVEQITIALIYKFMDDMDTQSEAIGGHRSFFQGEFSQYRWANVVRAGRGGEEMFHLYDEGIRRMPENPSIPELFRSIFRNMRVPYSDPETLREFLKTIDSFEYDDSEHLGDAYEYLLSILGSQGDAGQFRTPRHIIDFMVAIVDPKKHETVLDPACGTAGFLISSFKHILAANTDAEGNSTLTSEDRDRLARTFFGYDIAPDMVRLSRVNMYLHGFRSPRIDEYDTLTSDDHWNEHADVILANPPFMSPKGGIRPHKRFSVQSNRSEVLFVDYMAEHLTPSGRAGIIVPEGVIFQSGNAYKQLRRMLVENYLVAVISLPAGVFNPYSGVKTSILILDRVLARKASSIGFFKVVNDGFSLGAQRREVEANDLPDLLREVGKYLDAIRDSRCAETDLRHGQLVAKTRLAEDGDYNLSAPRYSMAEVRYLTYPEVSFSDTKVFSVVSGGTPRTDVPEYWGGDVHWVTLADLPSERLVTRISSTSRTITDAGVQDSSAVVVPAGTVVVSTRATIGRVGIAEQPLATNQGFKNVIIEDLDNVVPAYVAFAITRLVPKMQALATGGTFRELSKSRFAELGIPLPPLDIQREIVAEIEGYQRVIDGARAVVDNYRPRIDVDPQWPMVELGSIVSIGGTITTQVDPELPYYGADSIESGTGRIIATRTAGNQGVSGPVHEFSGCRLLYSKIRPYLNKLTIVDTHGYCSSDMYPLLVDTDRADIQFVAAYMLSRAFEDSIRSYYDRASIPKINRAQLFATLVPLPSLAGQQVAVADFVDDRTLVEANREVIVRMKKRIAAVLDRVWGEARSASKEV